MLADSGLSRLAWSVQVNLLAMGSPDFMYHFSPPEMRLPEFRVPEFPGVHPFAVDIWPLGVCIMNLVLGFNPFQTYTDQYRSIINQMNAAQAGPTPYARDGVHIEYDKEADYYALPRLVKLIDGLLSVDPARRLDIAGADALAALI